MSGITSKSHFVFTCVYQYQKGSFSIHVTNNCAKKNELPAGIFPETRGRGVPDVGRSLSSLSIATLAAYAALYRKASRFTVANYRDRSPSAHLIDKA